MRIAGDLIAVATGGAVGALLRYGVSVLTLRAFHGHGAWGTLAVNLAGCFAIGFLWSRFELTDVDRRISLLVVVGLLGSFTTFSTYALEGVQLIWRGQSAVGLSYIFASNLVGLLLVVAGLAAGRAAS